MPPASVLSLARALQSHPRFGPRFARWHSLPPRTARISDFPARVSPRLVDLYRSRGIDALYEHQARAIDAALSQRDVLVSTPTASGKTLCYAIPALQALLDSQGSARALFLYPTKALSQDQSAGLGSLVEALGEPWHAF